MKYDDASWHECPDHPEEKAIHLGFYMHWLIERNLISSSLVMEAGAAPIRQVAEGYMSGYEFMIQYCDGVIVDEDMNDEGKQFTDAYYKQLHNYDLDVAFSDVRGTHSFLTMKYDRSNYRRLADVLDRRFKEWKEGGLVMPPKMGLLQGIKGILFGRSRKSGYTQRHK